MEQIRDYKIIKEFSAGGQAESFLAETKTKEKVVIKKLSVKKVKSWKSVELFERESQILSQLKHPFIPTFIDAFHHEQEKEEEFYLVQEYIDGHNLAEYVQKGRRFTLKEALHIIEQLLHIMQYLHGFTPSIIHRDIKPSNIILKESNNKLETYLIDFGTVNNAIMKETGNSTVVGTIGYMAVEQIMGKANERSDLYSIGAVLLFLLTRKDPESLDMIDMQIQFEDEPALKALENRSVILFLKKLLHKEESKRYKNSKEALKALSKVQDDKLKEEIERLPIQSEATMNKRRAFESLLFGGSLIFGVAYAVYIYLVNFNSYSEEELIKVVPFWLSPLLFGLIGSLKAENKFRSSLIFTSISMVLLIFFIYFIFPSL